jgi:hypothetical protein
MPTIDFDDLTMGRKRYVKRAGEEFATFLRSNNTSVLCLLYHQQQIIACVFVTAVK